MEIVVNKTIAHEARRLTTNTVTFVTAWELWLSRVH